MSQWDLHKLLFWASLNLGHVLLLVRDGDGLCLVLFVEPNLKICAKLPEQCREADYIRLGQDKYECLKGLPSEYELRHYVIAIIVDAEL